MDYLNLFCLLPKHMILELLHTWSLTIVFRALHARNYIYILTTVSRALHARKLSSSTVRPVFLQTVAKNLLQSSVTTYDARLLLNGTCKKYTKQPSISVSLSPTPSGTLPICPSGLSHTYTCDPLTFQLMLSYIHVYSTDDSV